MRWSGHDALLSFHVLVAAAALLIGPVAMWARKRRGLHTSTGETYFWVVSTVCVTGGGLALLEWEILFVLIGEGGMGQVWQATDTQLGRRGGGGS